MISAALHHVDSPDRRPHVRGGVLRDPVGPPRRRVRGLGLRGQRYRLVDHRVITGIVGLIAIFLDVATSTSFINFGAFTAFTLVNAAVVFHYVRQRRAGQQLNPVSYVVVPVIGAIICAYLLSRLDSNAITLGVSWLMLGVVVLALITRGFKASPPEMMATEKATVEAAA